MWFSRRSLRDTHPLQSRLPASSTEIRIRNGLGQFVFFLPDYLRARSWLVHVTLPNIYLCLLLYCCVPVSIKLHPQRHESAKLSPFAIFSSPVRSFIWFFTALPHFASSAQQRGCRLFHLFLSFELRGELQRYWGAASPSAAPSASCTRS